MSDLNTFKTHTQSTYPTPRNALFVRSYPTIFTPSNAHDISATKRATGDPLVSKRPDFRGLFGFSKKYEILDFWISGFLDFWIFLDFRLYLGNEKSYQKSAGVKTTRFLRAFWIFQKNMKF